MIDISALVPDQHRGAPSKIVRSYTDTLKNRKIIVSRYQNIGNAQDYSQIPHIERNNFNISGSKARSESRPRISPRRHDLQENQSNLSAVQNLKQTNISNVRDRRVRITRCSSQASIGRKFSQNSHLNTERDNSKFDSTRSGHRKESDAYTNSSILKEKKFENVNTSVKGITEPVDILEELKELSNRYQGTDKGTRIASVEGSDKKTLPPLSKSIKSVTSISSITKTIKKKEQATTVKRPVAKDSSRNNNQLPQARLVSLISKEFTDERDLTCNYSNPILAIFEDIPIEEFSKVVEGELLGHKKLLEYVESNENWDNLGALIDIHTDQNLDYQVTFNKLKKNNYFNSEDFGLLEWRTRNDNTTVRKIFHRQSLKAFALRSINMEKFNNDPADMKNDLRISSMLSKYPHKNILRLVSSRMGIASESSPRHKRSDDFDSNNDGQNDFLCMKVEIISELGVGNLREVSRLRKKLGQNWTEQELIVLMKEIASAMAHCESLGISHRNIKPSNIFFGEDKVTVKLTDFKLGLLIGAKKQKIIESNVVGTPRYMSYELKKVYSNLKAKKSVPSLLKYDPFLSDVSSLALVILELAITAIDPNEELKLEAESAGSILKQIEDIYPYLTKILQRMLSQDPGMRPRFSEIETSIHLPIEAQRREVYEKRYNILSQLDEQKRGTEMFENLDECLETVKVYVRIVMGEKQAKKGPSNRESSGWKKDKEANGKEGELVTEKNLTGTIYRKSVVKMLQTCYEEYKRRGQYKKAIMMCNFMGDIVYQACQTDENGAFVYLLSNMARMNHLLNQCRESSELYAQAYNIAKKCYGEINRLTAMLLNNIGSLYYSMGETNRVKDVYNKALKIKELSGLKGELTYGVALHNLANIQQIAGEIKLAHSGYQEALKIYSSYLDKAEREIGEVYLAVSVLHYARQNDKQKGEEYISQALDVFENIPDEKLIGIAYYHLGLLKYCFREYEAAREAYETALKFLQNATAKQVGLIDAVKENLRTVKNEAHF